MREIEKLRHHKKREPVQPRPNRKKAWAVARAAKRYAPAPSR